MIEPSLTKKTQFIGNRTQRTEVIFRKRQDIVLRLMAIQNFILVAHKVIEHQHPLWTPPYATLPGRAVSHPSISSLTVLGILHAFACGTPWVAMPLLSSAVESMALWSESPFHPKR